MQQQGYGLPAIAAGLARGVAQNIYDTLFHGVELLDPVVVVGGVSKNRKVLQYLQEAVKRPLQALPDGEYIGAIGAALIALKQQRTGKTPSDPCPYTARANHGNPQILRVSAPVERRHEGSRF